MRSENWPAVAWGSLTLFTLFSMIVVLLLTKNEPTFTLTSKDWECIAWRAVSSASAETECTVYWRIN